MLLGQKQQMRFMICHFRTFECVVVKCIIDALFLFVQYQITKKIFLVKSYKIL